MGQQRHPLTGRDHPGMAGEIISERRATSNRNGGRDHPGMPGDFRRNPHIDDVDPDAGELTASFDGRAVTCGFGELDTLVPAYAVTIHKSQGSEYPVVVIPVLAQHYAMLQRNLLYTGVTRGKRLVVLVGQKKAVAIAVRNLSGRRRWSKLNEWLAVPAVRHQQKSVPA